MNCVRWACAALVVAAAALPGCHAFDKAEALPVRVVDAETRTPLAGAAVQLSSLTGQGAAAATAGKDGVASASVGREEHGEWVASVSAAGYLPATAELAAPSGGPVPPVEVGLFAGLAPTARVTLPDGYRGPVVVTVTVDPAAPPGRAFAAAASATGEAAVRGPAVVKLIGPGSIAAVSADGRAVPPDGGKEDTCFRWVRTAGPTFTFFVGTLAERDEYGKTLEPAPLKSAGGPGGPKGGRGGGGGRRGGGGRFGGGGM